MEPYYSDERVTLYLGDCREVLPSLMFPTLVVTDPPYGTGGWRRSASGNGSSPVAQLVQENWDDGAVDWLRHAEAVLTFWPAAHSHALLSGAVAAGLTKHRCLYMRKRDPKPQVDGRVRWSVEPIWALSRKGFLLYGGTDWISASSPRLGRDAEATGHPYQKPIGVMRWLLGKLGPDVRNLVDPFAGSGTTLRAAKDLGLFAVGIEQEERYCEIAARRLSQEVLDLTPSSQKIPNG